MKKYNYNEIKSILLEQKENTEIVLYILNTIIKDIEKNPKVYQRIDKRIESYMQKLFKNNKYNLRCSYYTNKNYGNIKYMYFSISYTFNYNVELEYYNDINYRKITIDSLNEIKDFYLSELNKYNNLLRKLKGNINKFNNLISKIELLYKENKGLEYILKVKEY